MRQRLERPLVKLKITRMDNLEALTHNSYTILLVYLLINSTVFSVEVDQPFGWYWTKNIKNQDKY